MSIYDAVLLVGSVAVGIVSMVLALLGLHQPAIYLILLALWLAYMGVPRAWR